MFGYSLVKKVVTVGIMVLLVGMGIGCDTSGDDDQNNGQNGGQISTDAMANEDLIAAFVANFAMITGMWTNNFFSSTGDFTVQSSYDDATNIFTIIIDIDGNVFGGADPDPETFHIDVSDFIANGTITINITSATYGDIALTLTFLTDGTGTVEATATNIPGVTNAQATGSFSIDSGSISFQVDSMSFMFGGNTITVTNTFD